MGANGVQRRGKVDLGLSLRRANGRYLSYIAMDMLGQGISLRGKITAQSVFLVCMMLIVLIGAQLSACWSWSRR
jgi:hypothetical protein